MFIRLRFDECDAIS